MNTAILSGKGGAGKTMIAVNLAAAAGESLYLDCDVEEPNGRLFFRPENIVTEQVGSLLPEFDKELCTGCRKCISNCRFNALIYIKNKPAVFPEICHSCGLCKEVCKAGAITEKIKYTGKIEKGFHGKTEVVSGILNLGEASGVSVIKAVQKYGRTSEKPVFTDCPPGSACSVSESIYDADFCIIAAEPTAFGFHNFRMVYELTQVLGKKTGVIINKAYEPYEPLIDFLKENNIPLLASIPYSEKSAELISEGKILVEQDLSYRKIFDDILCKIGGLL